MSIKDFDIIQTLGKGSFGSVHKVKRKADGMFYAMKKVPFVKLTDKEKEGALNEVRLIASINNPNIIAYKEAFFDGSTLCIVMEYCEHGDLLAKIEEHKRKGTSFQEGDIWRVFIQMAKGLKALHDLKIVHRDIKCANVFLSKNYEVKLGDFNVSKIAKKGLLSTQTGTPYYASPEVWKDKPYDSKSDIWSLGVVIYELCALRPPFTANSMQQLYKKIIQGSFPNIPSRYSYDLNCLIKMCLQLRPEVRPTCDSILQMEQVNKKLTETLKKFGSNSPNLISTIKFDRNVKVLQKRLPKPMYPTIANINPPARSGSEGAVANRMVGKPLYEIKEVPEKAHKCSPKMLPVLNKNGSKDNLMDKENKNHNNYHRPAPNKLQKRQQQQRVKNSRYVRANSNDRHVRLI